MLSEARKAAPKGREAVAAVIARHDWAKALLPALKGIWTDAMVVGTLSAQAVLAHHGVTEKADAPATLTLGVDWGAWAPGDLEAARQILGSHDALGRLMSMLDTGDEVADSIVVSRMDRLARTLIDGLEKGLAPAAIASQLKGILADPRWAHMVALTETTRAVSAATLLRYRQNGVDAKEWLTASDQRVCNICAGNEGAGSIPLGTGFPSGVDAPPAHPLCRCSLAPSWLTPAEAAAQGLLPSDQLLGQVGAANRGRIGEIAAEQEAAVQDLFAQIRARAAQLRGEVHATQPGEIAAGDAARGAASVAPQVRQSLAEAQSVKEVAAVARREAKALGAPDFKFDLQGHDLQTAREHAEGVLRGLERYPDVRVWVGHDSNDFIMAPYAETRGWAINFNTSWANTAGRQKYLDALEQDLRSGFHPASTSTPVGVSVHEFMHAATFGMKDLFTETAALIERRAAAEGITASELMRAELGGYAERDVHELVAEALAEAVIAGDNATPLAREILGLFEAEYRTAGKRVAELDIARPSLPGPKAAVKPLTGDAVASAVPLDLADRAAFEAAVGDDAWRSLNDYGGILHHQMNDIMRAGDMSQRFTTNIDRAMAASPIGQDVEVFRGIRLGGRGGAPFRGRLEGDLTGVEWTDAGYGSTSVQEGIARIYANNGGEDGMLMRIRVPGGTHAIMLSGGEAELLLERDLTYRVVADHGYEQFGKFRHRVIDVEVVPKAQAERPAVKVTPAKKATPAKKVAAPKAPKPPTTASLAKKVKDAGITVPTGLRRPALEALARDLDTGTTPAVARARALVTIGDERRATAKLLSDVDYALANKASDRAIATLAADVERALPAEVKARDVLAAALRSGDRDQIRTAMAALEKEAKLKPMPGKAGDVVKLDRRTMQVQGGARLADGAEVEVIRPGYTTVIEGETVRVPPVVAEVSEQTRNRLARVALRERQAFIDARTPAANLLAELDRDLALNQDAAVIREHLNAKIWPGIDPKVVDRLAAAYKRDGEAGLRSEIGKVSTAVKVKPVGKSGQFVKFDPETMQAAGGAPIQAGERVKITYRGSRVTLPGGEVVDVVKPVVVRERLPQELPIRELLDRPKAEHEQALKSVFEGKFGRYTTKVTKTGGGQAGVWAEGEIYDNKGHLIGRFSRAVEPSDDGKIWADHALLELDSARYQGTGFAREFNARAMEWYRASGVDGVYLSPVDIGKYAWASQGFDFAGDVSAGHILRSLREVVEDIRAGRTVDRYGDPFTRKLLAGPDIQAQLRAADAILARADRYKFGDPEYPTAREISQIGRWAGAGKTDRWLGKELMLKTAWQAVLMLR